MTQQKTTKSTRTATQRKSAENVNHTKATYTEEQVQQAIERAVKEALAANAAKTSSATIQVIPEEKVTLMYIGGMSQGCSVNLGNFGRITRDCGVIEVPKKAFINEANRVVDSLLQSRKLLVIDGLSEDERTRFGVLYKDDELLNEKTYRKLLDLPTEELGAIFKLLCEEHKKIVAKVFYSAAQAGDHRVSLEKVKTLNDISKETNKDGMFKFLLQNMAEEIAK
jgi:hypothetical protein